MCKKEDECGTRRYNKGRAEGVEHQSRKDTIKFLNLNWTLTEISDFVERSIDVVEAWAKESGLPYQVS